MNNFFTPSKFFFKTGILVLSIWLFACAKKSDQGETPSKLSFEAKMIADSITHLWAHFPVDITGDGLIDLVHITNNAAGGQLAYYKGTMENDLWEQVLIATNPPGGGEFALGDMECADIDFDGDIDVIAGKHTGEWEGGAEPTTLYWYENPTWEAHEIGQAANFVKDVSLADFNKDSKMDVAVLTYDSNSLTIFEQVEKGRWKKVQDHVGYNNLHEGMGVGDINGDSWIDIFANGHIFYNPKGDLAATWEEENLDEKWNNQEGDWSKNGSKTALRDIDGDGKSEIFIAHSERAGYPLSLYRQIEGQWTKTKLADDFPACHTLQIFDFDLDGDFDVLAGVNRGRAINLDYTSFEVTIFLSADNYKSWKPFVIDRKGSYNAQVADLEGDGDLDIFRLHQHDDAKFHVYENLMK